jgi:cyclophilin family peptidyl-prolyl cis-trans isomerase
MDIDTVNRPIDAQLHNSIRDARLPGRLNRSGLPGWVAVCLALLLPGWAATSEPVTTHEDAALEAEIIARKPLIQMGRPVWLDFIIRNRSDEPITLTVADLPVAQDKPAGMGLPLEHVFSGDPGQSIDIRGAGDGRPERLVAPPLPATGQSVVIAPHCTVGTQLDLARYCEGLRRAGTYEIQWRPYHGTLQSNKLRLVVAPHREAVIHTDFGRMTMRFSYDEAPHHVENFIELAEKGFYDGLTFHRVVHGGLVQGGCPRGDGTGVRPDGKLLKAEISNLPIDLGSVVMATARNDPDSGSCQFYISLTRLRSLEGTQTVFAHLVGEESYETLRKIGSVPTGDQDRPLKTVYIRNISLDNIVSDEGGRIGGSPSTRPGTGLGSGRRGSGPLPAVGPSSGAKREPGATTRPAAPVTVTVGGEAKAVKVGSR